MSWQGHSPEPNSKSSVRRSRRSHKPPAVFAQQQSRLNATKELSAEQIEQLFKQQEEAKVHNKNQRYCMCGQKLSSWAKSCKACGWGSHPASRPAPRHTSPKPPRKPKPQKRGRPPANTYESHGGPPKRTKHTKSSSPRSGGRLTNLYRNKLWADLRNPLENETLESRRNRESQSIIKWKRWRYKVAPGSKPRVEVIIPKIPCDARRCCNRWFHRDARMLIHKCAIHLAPPFGYADEPRLYLEENYDSSEESEQDMMGGESSEDYYYPCEWPGCDKEFDSELLADTHYTLEHNMPKRPAYTGKRRKKRVAPRPMLAASKMTCIICLKKGDSSSRHFRIQMCDNCQKPVHVQCAIQESSIVQSGKRIYTCRNCHEKISRENMKQIEHAIPINNIFATSEKFDPKEAEVEYVNGYYIKAYILEGVDTPQKPLSRPEPAKPPPQQNNPPKPVAKPAKHPLPVDNGRPKTAGVWESPYTL